MRHAKDLIATAEGAASEWQRIIHAIDAVVLSFDMKGRVVCVNTAAMDLFGHKEGQVVPGRVKDLGEGQPWQKISECVDGVRQTQTRQVCQIKDPASGIIWDITAACSPGRGDDDRIIVLARDVSEMVLTQESLRRSEVMSELSALLGDFSHAVKNPLFGISATVDAFEARFGKREELQQYLEVLRGEVDRTKNLVRGLLEYSWPVVLGDNPEPIEEIIARAVDACMPLAKGSKVHIATEISGHLCRVQMDSSRLVQAFCSALTNAIEFSSAGDTVTIEAQKQRCDGKTWFVCSIKDRGPGFPSEDREKVFDPFFSSRYGGTGLGLSIVRRVVQDHNGTVSIGNRAGGGGVVTIRLECD